MPTQNPRYPSTFSQTLSVSIPIGLMLTIALTALAYGTVEPWSVTLLGLLITFLFALWMIKCAVDGRLKIQVPATLWPLVGLFVYGAVQSVAFTNAAGKHLALSLNTEATRLTLEIIGVLIIAMLIAANFLTGEQRIVWFKNFIVFFGLAMAVFGLVQHFTWNGKYYWVFQPSTPPSSPFGPFVNHNHFAGYLAMIAPIPLALILTRAVRGELSLFYAFAGVMMSVSAIVSLSRGGMISLFAGLMFIIAIGVKPAKRPSNIGRNEATHFHRSREQRFPLLLPRLGAAAAIIVVIFVGVWWMGADPVIRRMEKGELSIEKPSDDPRRESFFQSRGWIWRDTASMIRDNWITGIGLGAFQTAYPIYSKQDGSIIVGQAHNDYLQVLADAGIIGAGLALLFIVLVFRDLARALRHHNRVLSGIAVGCGGGVFAILVHSLFDFNLQLPSNALLFLVLTAVLSRIAASALAESKVGQSFPQTVARARVAA